MGDDRNRRIYRREGHISTPEEAIERANRELAAYFAEEKLPPDDDFNWHACPLCGDMTEGDCRYVKRWRETGVDTRQVKYHISQRNNHAKGQEEAGQAGGPGQAGAEAGPEEEVS